jgi:putative hydrolase of HD superfamily
MEGANIEKVVLMCLTHDFSEARSNDHNWVHKRYVAIDEPMIRKEQLGGLPTTLFARYADEYARRTTLEARVAKEADLLDQILLLREYSWQGNKEATAWLYGKGKQKGNEQLKKLTLKSSQKLGKAIYERSPSQWWEGLWTSRNRVV